MCAACVLNCLPSATDPVLWCAPHTWYSAWNPQWPPSDTVSRIACTCRSPSLDGTHERGASSDEGILCLRLMGCLSLAVWIQDTTSQQTPTVRCHIADHQFGSCLEQRLGKDGEMTRGPPPFSLLRIAGGGGRSAALVAAVTNGCLPGQSPIRKPHPSFL